MPSLNRSSFGTARYGIRTRSSYIIIIIAIIAQFMLISLNQVSPSDMQSAYLDLYDANITNKDSCNFIKTSPVPRTWKSRDSRARAVDVRSTFLIIDIINYNIIRGSPFLNDLERSLSNVCYIFHKNNINKNEKTFLK